MNSGKIFLVLSREFKIRVKKKSFILTTILTPLLFATMMIVPAIFSTISTGEKGNKVLIVDKSGICENFFKSNEEFIYKFDNSANVESIKKNFSNEGLYALIEISQPDSNLNLTVSAVSTKQMNISAKSEIEKNVQNAVEKEKLKKYNINNLDVILKDIRTKVNLKTFTLSEEGDEKLGIVEINMAISYIASFMSYIFIFMFGSMVMRGVIEEKTTRIVEVIVSSMKPFELMMGKILGVGSVALLQFLIWIVLTVGLVFGVQSVIGFDAVSQGGMATQMAPGGAGQMAASVASQSPMGEILTALAGVNWFAIIASFLIYFLLGYLLYAAMFSAVGSAVDNEADTQQLILPVTLPLIIGIFIMVHTFQFPDSSLSFWGSMIPFTSPMVMMARVSYGVPFWQLALSILLLFLTFIAMTFVSAKIYRIGILSYGKKGSWKEMIKWIKY